VYDNPPPKIPGTSRGAWKYGKRLGSVSQLASKYRDLASTYNVDTYGKRRTVNAFSSVFMLKTLKCPVRIVWVFHRSQWVALFTTDMTISIEQIIEFYAARWKIEAAFKELKQDIGSQRSQTRNKVAVKNHLQFCMMAMTITWIYASKLDSSLTRRHRVNGRGSFAFSDIRRTIAKSVLTDDFLKGLLKSSKPTQNTLASVLLRMVA
ncbi:MAG: transposase, partial [Magnetococcales bacterium]|nr:transposase [Magnetococcales bacterium]